mgnify:CR=1 FL=1
MKQIAPSFVKSGSKREGSYSMKHYVKIIAVLLVAIFLIGCTKGEEKSAHEKNEENRKNNGTTRSKRRG